MENILDSALSHTRTLTNQNAETSQEAAWVAASQRGDAVSFNRLVLKWERPIYNLSLRMLRDADEAAEATQEVFLLAFKGIRRFRLGRAVFYLAVPHRGESLHITASKASTRCAFVAWMGHRKGLRPGIALRRRSVLNANSSVRRVTIRCAGRSNTCSQSSASLSS